MIETDLWEYSQKITHYRYISFFESQLIAIADADLELEAN